MHSSPKLAALLFAFLPAALSATPMLSTTAVTPSSILVNQATPITATCQLTTNPGDPALLPNGMNLVRLTAAGADSTILGAMTAGANNTYSYTFTDTEPTAGQYQLQCTAAFAATPQRVRSAAATITVTAPLAAPTITSFTPLSGTTGTIVTVTGTNLVSNTGVAASILLASQNGGTLAAPLSTANATTLTFVIPAGAATGPVTASLNGLTAASTATLTINPSSTFTISALPASASLIMGQTVALSVQLMSTTGFNQLAPLSVSGLPAGVTASFKPSSITAGQTSVLTLSAPANQPISTANLNITAAATVSGIPLTQNATATLSVQAPTTTFLGRTVVADSTETPLAGVTVTMLGLNGGGSTTGCTGSTVSDAAGNFALTGLSASCVGPQLVGFNGNTVTSPAGKYAGVNLVYTLVSGQVTASPVLVHLPMITGAETFDVQQNAATDQTYSFTSIPGLTVTVYAHTTFTQEDGTQPNPFPLVAVNVPVDRLPEQMPTTNTMVMGFIVAFQPANVVASQPVAITYPNTLNATPGSTLPLMTLNPTLGRMVPYGTATVSADSRSVVPNIDSSTGSAQHHFGIVNFDWHGWASPPPNQNNPYPNNCDPTIMSCIPPAPPPCTCGGSNPSGTAQSQGSGPSGGDPVDLSSGLFYKTAVDLAISGNRGSISIQRIYRNASTNEGPFGPGSQMQYGWYLNTAAANTAAAINLIAPDGNQFVFSRQADNTLTNSSVVSLQGITMTTNSGNVATLLLRNGTVWQFQPSGSLSYLSAITDRNGNTIGIAQAGVGPGLLRITQITDPVGRSIRMTYDSNGHMTSAVDPVGRTVSYTYNPSGTLASFTDANGGVAQYQYDSQNRIVSETDPRGVVLFQNTYDANGRIVSQIQPDGGIVSFAYTLVTPMVPTSPVQLTIATDALGNRTSYRFNPQGYLTDVIDAVGQTKNFLRAPGTNLLLQITGSAQCSVCGPPGRGSVSYTYDPLGNALTSTDALGNTTTYTYDPVFSQVTSITDALGDQSKFSYDSAGNLTSSTDANSHTTTFTYDSTGLPLTVTDPLGNVSKVSYSLNGDPFYFTDALGNVTSYGFDGISRVTTVADSLGKKTTYTFDALNGLTFVKDGRGSTTQFSYDPVGNLLSLTDPRGNATTFTYDSFSRVKTRISALGKSESHQYDFNGNQTQFTDRRGQISQFQYDVLNRLVKETYQDASVTRTYDSYSRLLTVNDSVGGPFNFGYDLNGSLVLQGEPTGSISYTRDQIHRVATRQVAGQSLVRYSYDPGGNMLGASMPSAGISYSYDARNLPTSALRTNGVVSTYTFDPLGRVLSLIHSRGTTALNAQTYTYDPSGNRNSATNDISQPLITNETTATVDVGNELLTNGPITYTNDANGNRLTETSSAGTVTYQWDSRNRLSSITDASGDMTLFKYDFRRNLIEIDKSAAGSLMIQRFVVDNLANVASLTDALGLPASVLTGRSIDSQYATVDSSGNVAFGVGDALGNTIAVADSGGALASRLDYEAYGQTTGSAPLSYPFAFTGRVPINQSVYYFRNRYYDGATGRFLSEDQLLASDWLLNPYRYARSNPLRYLDPRGLESGSGYPSGTINQDNGPENVSPPETNPGGDAPPSTNDPGSQSSSASPCPAQPTQMAQNGPMPPIPPLPPWPGGPPIDVPGPGRPLPTPPMPKLAIRDGVDSGRESKGYLAQKMREADLPARSSSR